MTLSADHLLAEAEKLAQDMAARLGGQAVRTLLNRRGAHRRHRPGAGDDFWQFRGYDSGDMPRQIDWRMSGRHDAVFVREKEAESPRRVTIWRDGTEGMGYRSTSTTLNKRDYADIIWLALASLLVKAGEAVATVAVSRAPCVHPSGIADLYFSSRSNMPSLLSTAELPAQAGSMVIVMSDFAAPADRVISSLRRRLPVESDIILLQVNDRAEEDFSFAGNLSFRSAASSPETYIFPRAEAARQDYIHAFAAHRQALKDAAKAQGWDFFSLTTDQPAALSLVKVLAAAEGEGR